MVKDRTRVSDDDVGTYCDLLASQDAGDRCDGKTLSAVAEALVPRRYIMRTHLESRWATHPDMKVFVFGHTHQLSEGLPVPLKNKTISIAVHNTGAFQRVVDERGLILRAQKKNLQPNEFLRGVNLEDLPACYGLVRITFKQPGFPQAETLLWRMEEDGRGSMVLPGDSRCQ
jgi:hypothetical protein